MPDKKSKRKLLLQGNEACAMGAIDAGCRFFGGYPITPSTEIAELLSEELPKVGGKFIQMEDELGSICACIGASIAGSKSLTATSGPGFSLMQEGIGYGCLTETPVVIVNVMRGGPSTGLPTCTAQGDMQQSRFGTHGDHEIIVLSASNVKECYDNTIKAFNFAEKYRTPVILLLDEVVAHMRQNVELPARSELVIINRKKPEVHPDWYVPYDRDLQVPVLADFGEGYRYNVTGLIHDDLGYPTNDTSEIEALTSRIMRKIEDSTDDICTAELIDCENPDVIVIAFGSVVLSAREAIRKVHLKNTRQNQRITKLKKLWPFKKDWRPARIGLVKLETIWPFPDKILDQLIESCRNTCKKIIVAEMSFGQVFREIERINRGRLPLDGYFQVNGELAYPEAIFKKITGVLS
ncbi:MAG: 2-oxoacid:acceptor oxidoreductase subunit alpha [Candidatus Wallbacteria bacterium]|nr:2-oxoacid:acceptor oxidoreductase subunit alpha [Candidatus Wallbacteria bacterium]